MAKSNSTELLLRASISNAKRNGRLSLAKVLDFSLTKTNGAKEICRMMDSSLIIRLFFMLKDNVLIKILLLMN